MLKNDITIPVARSKKEELLKINYTSLPITGVLHYLYRISHLFPQIAHFLLQYSQIRDRFHL